MCCKVQYVESIVQFIESSDRYYTEYKFELLIHDTHYHFKNKNWKSIVPTIVIYYQLSMVGT